MAPPTSANTTRLSTALPRRTACFVQLWYRRHALLAVSLARRHGRICYLYVSRAVRSQAGEKIHRGRVRGPDNDLPHRHSRLPEPSGPSTASGSSGSSGGSGGTSGGSNVGSSASLTITVKNQGISTLPLPFSPGIASAVLGLISV
jgi:hypothetical protein